MRSKIQSLFRIHPRLLTAALFAFLFLAASGSGWLWKHIFSENARFEQFTENLFEKEVSGNILTLHYSLAYPDDRGFPPPTPLSGL